MSILLRSARSTDAGKLGAMITEAVQTNTWKPQLHSAAQDVAHMGDLIDRGWVTVCAQGSDVTGFLARNGQVVQSLYVKNCAQNRGIGSALLSDAKARQDRLELWAFQANTGAQRFYLKHDFTVAERTDGSGNDEGLPDMRYVWTRVMKGQTHG